jgi:glycine cleavage system regulatory protein
VNTSLVLTLVSADRPGVVESVAEIVAAHGGNWLESRMARLGGQFAGIARVEVPATSAVAVRQALAALAARGLSVSVAGDATGLVAAAKGTPALLELVGQDRPGIIHQITHVLAAHQVNVEELTTECVEAPMAGGILFQAKAEVLVPAGADMAGLRRDLEKIAGDLMVDLTFREAK